MHWLITLCVDNGVLFFCFDVGSIDIVSIFINLYQARYCTFNQLYWKLFKIVFEYLLGGLWWYDTLLQIKGHRSSFFAQFGAVTGCMFGCYQYFRMRRFRGRNFHRTTLYRWSFRRRTFRRTNDCRNKSSDIFLFICGLATVQDGECKFFWHFLIYLILSLAPQVTLQTIFLTETLTQAFEQDILLHETVFQVKLILLCDVPSLVI